MSNYDTYVVLVVGCLLGLFCMITVLSFLRVFVLHSRPNQSANRTRPFKTKALIVLPTTTHIILHTPKKYITTHITQDKHAELTCTAQQGKENIEK